MITRSGTIGACDNSRSRDEWPLTFFELISDLGSDSKLTLFVRSKLRKHISRIELVSALVATMLRAAKRTDDFALDANDSFFHLC